MVSDLLEFQIVVSKDGVDLDFVLLFVVKMVFDDFINFVYVIFFCDVI